MRPRVFSSVRLSEQPNEIRMMCYNRMDEPEKQEFISAPFWMFRDPPDLERVDLPALIQQRMETLTDREQSILRLRFWEEWTLEEIGQQMQITRERVRQVEMRAMRKLRRPSVARDLEPYLEWLEWMRWSKKNKSRRYWHRYEHLQYIWWTEG